VVSLKRGHACLCNTASLTTYFPDSAVASSRLHLIRATLA
jgi:hypothetical protein